jgi:formylglycine-generating enzyme required for sulfatase activity
MPKFAQFFNSVFVAIVLSAISGCQNERPKTTATQDTAKTDQNEIAGDVISPLQNGASKSDNGRRSDDVPQSFVETIPGSLVEFEMRLVPGDPHNGIPSFYLGKHEVTWDEFGYWALCADISEKKAIVEREKKLRPSAPHDSESIYRGWGKADQPAIGVSRRSAEEYCRWLSQQTGKKYRLPTDREWSHAFVSGGGDLSSSLEEDQLSAIAWHLGNSLDEEAFDNRAMPVGKRKPNSIGIHDMLGNAAEWVTETGDQNVVRGGSFLTEAKELRADHRQIEVQSVWNKNYPNEPKSIWWYVDADFVGFRLACEVEVDGR